MLYDSKGMLCNAKNLTMDRVMYQKNLIPALDAERLNELASLTLKDGKELQCLIDTTGEGHHVSDRAAFSNLVELVIQNMSGFEMLCNGPFPKDFLQKLEMLEIRDCMELFSLSPMPQNLKILSVINCGQLQQVLQIEELLHDIEEIEAPLLSNLTILELESLPDLKWLWKGPSHYLCLQSLKVAEISRCNELKYLFSHSLTQSLVLLENLKIAHCDELEHIITTVLEFDDNVEAGGHLHHPLLPNLTSLDIIDCPKLEYVLKILQLKQVFDVSKEKDGVDHAIALPSLQHLKLGNLINLSGFSSVNYPIVSPSLEVLQVWDCLRLSNFTIQKEVNDQVQLKVYSMLLFHLFSMQINYRPLSHVLKISSKFFMEVVFSIDVQIYLTSLGMI